MLLERYRVALTWSMLLLFSFVAVRAVQAQDITQLGGDLTSPLQDRNAIQLPAPNVTDTDRRATQLSGFAIFHRLVQPDEGLGPKFNNSSCGGCHVSNGRGVVRLSPKTEESTMIVKVSRRKRAANGAPVDIPKVGEQLQDRATSGKSLYKVKLQWISVPGRYPDGTRYTLRKPQLSFDIPNVDETKISSSLRMTPPVIGPGLLEAISEETILALSDPDDGNGDGISGRPQYVIDRRTGELALGRFGFKASHPTVEQQSAAAAFNDIGVTNPLFTKSGTSEEMSEDTLNRLVVYQQLAGVPAARDQEDPTVVQGKALFQSVGCDGCHKVTLTTGTAGSPEVQNQTIHPFTDLLLHDMGRDLADGRGEFEAGGREWRTTPLWGLGFSKTLSEVNARFLHDGRARTVEEAILWHGGEASASRLNFKNLSASDRAALIAFLNSL